MADDFQIMYFNALKLLAQKKYVEAAQGFSRLISMGQDLPDDEWVLLYTSRAKCYQSIKDYSLAVQDCDQAISIDRTHADSYALKCKILIAQKKLKEANDVVVGAKALCGEHQDLIECEILLNQSWFNLDIVSSELWQKIYSWLGNKAKTD